MIKPDLGCSQSVGGCALIMMLYTRTICRLLANSQHGFGMSTIYVNMLLLCLCQHPSSCASHPFSLQLVTLICCNFCLLFLNLRWNYDIEGTRWIRRKLGGLENKETRNVYECILTKSQLITDHQSIECQHRVPDQLVHHFMDG